jgi:DNA-binding GntR family transcriptional regulator
VLEEPSSIHSRLLILKSTGKPLRVRTKRLTRAYTDISVRRRLAQSFSPCQATYSLKPRATRKVLLARGRLTFELKTGLNSDVAISKAGKRNKLKASAALSLSSKAYLLIRERILRGELRPGQALSSRQLAKGFEMSLVPVSQALRQLESDKLVESRPRAGTRVRIPRPEEIRGQCIVREALEAQSARLCCARATMKERLELMRMAEQLDTLYDRFASEDGSDLLYVVHTHHFELHMRISEYARCPELKEAIERNQVLIYNWFFDIAAHRRRLPPGFHGKLLRAVTGSDPLVADAAMRRHVQYGVPESLHLIVPQSRDDWRLRRSRSQAQEPSTAMRRTR